ncbi:hypothetical protein [Flavobacterium tistrianum]|uniref:hypothetical protein n=1 Tax=Flavobacterium tistrianum TaxID=1685414 RepID=UPI000DAF12BA|nr:hypothetical protein [Flavobacterium tistrianum]KAF2343068.1 hypothetical protein DMB71_00615 [Flavobacterium tistrianum]
MTIKEINVEKGIQTSVQKKQDLNQIVFFNATFKLDQYCVSSSRRMFESRNCLHLKTKTAREIPIIMTAYIGLPRPFY